MVFPYQDIILLRYLDFVSHITYIRLQIILCGQNVPYPCISSSQVAVVTGVLCTSLGSGSATFLCRMFSVRVVLLFKYTSDSWLLSLFPRRSIAWEHCSLTNLLTYLFCVSDLQIYVSCWFQLTQTQSSCCVLFACCMHTLLSGLVCNNKQVLRRLSLVLPWPHIGLQIITLCSALPHCFFLINLLHYRFYPPQFSKTSLDKKANFVYYASNPIIRFVFWAYSAYQ